MDNYCLLVIFGHCGGYLLILRRYSTNNEAENSKTSNLKSLIVVDSNFSNSFFISMGPVSIFSSIKWMVAPTGSKLCIAHCTDSVLCI